MIADMTSKKNQPIFIELLISGRKVNISLSFITQSSFVVPKSFKTYTLFYYENSKQSRTSTTRN